MSIKENEPKRAPSDEPLVFDPDAVYTKRALEKLLGGVVSLDRFLARIRPPQIFKGCYRGVDLIQAIAACPTLDQIKKSGPRRLEIAVPASTIGSKKAPKSGPNLSESIRGCPPGLEPIHL